MPDNIQCANCRSELKVPDRALGKQVRYPVCKETFYAGRRESAGERPESPPPGVVAGRPAPPDTDYRLTEPDGDDDDVQFEVVEKGPPAVLPADDGVQEGYEEVPDEEPDLPAPRRRKKRRGPERRVARPARRTYAQSSNAFTLLILSVGSVVLGMCCCLGGWIGGGYVIWKAREELLAISYGEMDPAEGPMTWVALGFGVLAVLAGFGSCCFGPLILRAVGLSPE